MHILGTPATIVPTLYAGIRDDTYQNYRSLVLLTEAAADETQAYLDYRAVVTNFSTGPTFVLGQQAYAGWFKPCPPLCNTTSYNFFFPDTVIMINRCADFPCTGIYVNFPGR